MVSGVFYFDLFKDWLEFMSWLLNKRKIVSKNRCKPSVHIFVLFWSLTTLTVKFSQTKQLLSIYNVWKILWAGLKGSTQRKIMMLKSEMTFTNKLRSVGSRLRIFLSWLAGCFRFLLLSFLVKVSYFQKEIFGVFKLRQF